MTTELGKAKMDRYTKALDDAFGGDAQLSRFAGWLKNLKGDVFVGNARAGDKCPLHDYLSEHFAIDDVVFRVTESHLHVHHKKFLGTGEQIVAIPMPPVARRFVLVVDGGRKRDVMGRLYEDDYYPPVTAKQALRCLRVAYEDESDLVSIITFDDDGQYRERRGRPKVAT